MSIAAATNKLARLAQKQLDMEHEVALGELNLADKKKQLNKLAEVDIPELMEELEMDTVKTKSGLVVDVTEKIRGSITVANRIKAHAWLRKKGHGKLIKGKLIVTPKDEKHMAVLEKRMAKLDLKVEEGVHGNTLSAWVREMLQDGKDVPEKLFGVFRQRRSKITVKGE